MTRRLVTLLMVMAASDLATPEGVAVTTAAKKTPAPSLLLQGNVSQASGWTVVHVTDNTSRDPPPSSTAPHQDQPASPPTFQENSRSNLMPGGETGRDDNSVDTVLAALVDYSKDPKLWRFVHSVVDELDYSLRASHPAAPSSPIKPWPVLHLSSPITHWGRTPSPDGKHEPVQSVGWSGGSESHITRKGPTERTTTNTLSSPTWIHHPPKQPFINSRTTQDYNMSSDILALNGPNRINFARSLSSPSPHFLFHRVFIDRTLDTHTRHPYQRPVLALTARETEAEQSSVNKKDSSSSIANHTTHQPADTIDAKELTSKFNTLSPPTKDLGVSSEGKELSQTEEYGGISDLKNVLRNTHHHHHHHHRHRLHTFKSQLKFLQRWEGRLRPHHHSSC